jgi:hypothetical protein
MRGRRISSDALTGNRLQGELLPPAVKATGAMVPDSEKAYFEDRLGHDFSRVRVHTDERAANWAAAFGAKAFATGDDIVFAAGRYEPSTITGRRLLAHELTHVAQQARGGPASTGAEPRARAAAEEVTSGGHVSAESIGGAEHSVQCDEDEEKKKDEAPAPPRLPPLNFPKLMPPTLTPPTWLTLQRSFLNRGLRLDDRDANSIMQTWDMNSRLLDTLGITDQFKLGPITKKWILEKGITKQVEDMQARENPNAMDRSNLEFEKAYPGGFKTPIINLLDLEF